MRVCDICRKRISEGLHGETIIKLADRIGISRQYYSAIEMGTRQKNMDITLISALSKIFEVSLEYIIELENEWKMQQI